MNARLKAFEAHVEALAKKLEISIEDAWLLVEKKVKTFCEHADVTEDKAEGDAPKESATSSGGTDTTATGSTGSDTSAASAGATDSTAASSGSDATAGAATSG